MIKMLGGLVSVVSVAALVIGCGGADSSPPVGDSTDGTKEEPSQAKLPNKSEGTPAKSDKAPSGGTATPPGTPGTEPDPNTLPGKDGEPGQPGLSGVCCYNNTSYDCPDQKSCLGGYDYDACQDACADADFDCQIACAQKLGTVKGPTNACTAKGKCN